MHHYTSCGLENVWLQNGFQEKQTAYGKAVAVADADALHETLAVWLTKKAGRLTGKEFRFLRTLMCLSQSSLGKMMGASEQAVSLWERTGKVPKASDALMRMIILERLCGDGKVSDVINRINAVERLVNQRIIAHARKHEWTARVSAPGL